MSVDSRPKQRAPLADPKARKFLRKVDPVLAQLIDERPDFRPRAWKDELPPFDAFGTPVFQVAGQQLSVASTRAIIRHLEGRFGGHMPSAKELLAADPQLLREAGFSARKGQTLRALAERFVDGRLSDEALARMTDEEVEAALTEVSGIGLWTARGFLLVALDRPDVFLSGDLALRRAIQRAYGFDHLPTEDEVAEVSDRWRPYRSLAVSYLFASQYGEGTQMDITGRASMVEPLDERVDHVRGEAGTPVILEYGDYECPYSRQAFRAIERVERELSGRVRFAFRHFPLTQIHPHALAASAAAEAAARQGRFWELHDLLFHRQKALEDDDLRLYADELGLDLARFDRDRADPEVLVRIERDVASGDATGVVRGTPTLFVDGVLYQGGYNPAAFIEAVAR